MVVKIINNYPINIMKHIIMRSFGKRIYKYICAWRYKMSRIDGYGIYQQTFASMQAENSYSKAAGNDNTAKWNPDENAAIYEPTKSPEKAVTYSKNIDKAAETKQASFELSDAAKALLEELKEKYGEDTDFIIANYSSEEEAQALMARGKKEYTVLIDPELLEQMASDESIKEENLSKIDAAKEQMKSMMDELGEDGKEVESVGVSINGDGTLSYFAKMREDTQARSKQIEEDLKTRREEKREERAKEDEERIKARIEKNHDKASVKEDKAKTEDNNVIKADSIEDLIAKIRQSLGVKAE